MCTCYMLWFYVKMLSSHLFCFEWYNWCVFFYLGVHVKKGQQFLCYTKFYEKFSGVKKKIIIYFKKILPLIWFDVLHVYFYHGWTFLSYQMYISILCCDVQSITKDSTVLWHSISCIREKKIRHDSCMKWYKTQKYSLVIV